MDRILLLCEEATLTAAMERTGQLFRKLSKSGKGVGWIADGDFYSKSKKGRVTALIKWPPYWQQPAFGL